MPLLSIRAYARHRGVSHVAVLKALKTKRISARKDGKINPAVADREWARNTDPAKPLNSETGEPKRRRKAGESSRPVLHRPAGAGDSAAAPAGGGGGGVSYVDARAAREAIDAQIRRIELDRLRGKLVDADKVRALFFTATRRARDQLLALEDSLAPALMNVNDELRIRELIRTEITRVLEELAASPTSVPATAPAAAAEK